MTTASGEPILDSGEREYRAARLKRWEKAVVGAVLALIIIVPPMLGFATVKIASDLSTLNKHQSATALCEGLNATNQHIQSFVLELAQQSTTPPTAAQILALQQELDANFPQTDCTQFPITPPTTAVTVAPVTTPTP